MTIEMTVLDFYEEKLTEEICDDIRQIWADYGYANDNCIHKWNAEYHSDKYPAIAQYLKDEGIVWPVWIHYWW